MNANRILLGWVLTLVAGFVLVFFTSPEMAAPFFAAALVLGTIRWAIDDDKP